MSMATIEDVRTSVEQHSEHVMTVIQLTHELMNKTEEALQGFKEITVTSNVRDVADIEKSFEALVKSLEETRDKATILSDNMTNYQMHAL